MRKLATVQKIVDIKPIENKDLIVLATVLGWKCIIQKGQFKVGDLCIYIEPDSILPERSEFEFLRSRCYSKKWKGFRIRTMKMGEVYSQGIIFDTTLLKKKYNEGDDVTKELKIIKYDTELKIEMNLSKKKHPFLNFILKYFPFMKRFLIKRKKERWPSFLQKTDETRVQILPHVLEENKEVNCYVTEKLDGCSATYAIKDGKFYVCSRNIHLNKSDNSHYWRVAKKYLIEARLRSMKRNVAIQGEIIGPGIRNGCKKNLYMLDDIEFYVYQIYDIDRQKYIVFDTFLELCSDLVLQTVPILCKNLKLDHTVDQLVGMAKGRSMLYNAHREGVVIRSMDNKPYGLENVGSIFSFKVINPEFLIKHNL